MRSLIALLILVATLSIAQDKPKPIQLDPVKIQKRFETLQEEKKKADEMIVYWTTRSNTINGQMAELQNVVLDKSLAPADTAKPAKAVK